MIRRQFDSVSVRRRLSTGSSGTVAGCGVASDATAVVLNIKIWHISGEGNAKVFKLYIDGKLVNAQLAVKGAIQIPPGEHTVVIASAPAGLRIERTFDFEAGADYIIELTMDFLYSEK